MRSEADKHCHFVSPNNVRYVWAAAYSDTRQTYNDSSRPSAKDLRNRTDGARTNEI